MNLCKAAYSFVQGLEFAAVQIIAVNTVQNSGSHKAGYMMKTGILIQNNVSTGDLNRGRRVKPRLLFGSFCRSKKNVKTFPVGAARCACYEASKFCKPRCSAPLRGFSAACGGYPCCFRNNRLPLRGICRGVEAPPPPVHTKRVCRLLCKHSQAAKPPFGRSLPGTFHLLLKKQDKRGVGTLSRSLLWEKTA